MKTTRMEAFSDGVLAIIITIMVLELKVPESPDFYEVKKLYPVIISYVLSFIYLGIYWNNHHHLLTGTDKINGAVLWANLHLLFWLSLVPFVTGWMGENHFDKVPVRWYGVVLFMSAIAYLILQRALIVHNGKNSKIAQALSKDKKGIASLLIYAAAIGLSFFSEWVAGGLYFAVALMWLIPERRIEKKLED